MVLNLPRRMSRVPRIEFGPVPGCGAAGFATASAARGPDPRKHSHRGGGHMAGGRTARAD